MASSSTVGTVVKLGAIGGLGYLAWQWYESSQASTPSPVVATSAGVSPAAAAGAVTSSTPLAPYSGPSLDQIYSMLVAAALKGMQGGDTAVSCPGMSGYRRRGFGVVVHPVESTDPASLSLPLRAIAGGVPARSTSTDSGSRAPAAAAPVSCATPSASPWVFNSYLVNLGVGLSSPPDITVAFPGADYSQPMTASTYWAGVSPLISKALGMSGLGHYGFSFRRAGMGQFYCRGFGDALSDLMATSGTNVDTNAGSYSTNPAGETIFTPAPLPAASIIPNVSNGALALGVGVAVLAVALGGGRRR